MEAGARLVTHAASCVLLCFSFSDCMTLWVHLYKCRCSIEPGENKGNPHLERAGLREYHREVADALLNPLN